MAGVIPLQHVTLNVRRTGRNNMTSKQILIVEDERPIREMYNVLEKLRTGEPLFGLSQLVAKP